MKVLIVEDDEAVKFFMAMAVKSQGHETKQASNGAEGLKTFKEFHPDLIFSDINMPVMNGLEMLETIRKTDSNVVVIINSTLDSPEYTLKALRLKANDYLVKPVLEKDVVSLLQKYTSILTSRTVDREILGMIYRRDLGMNISNRVELVGKIVDRLMLETEQAIPLKDRLGIHLGLVEMITNSIEHGNLGISYDEKTIALEGTTEDWCKFLETRAKTAPYADRLVNLEFRLSKERCEWVITDQGEGFDWTKLPDPNDPENLLASHGRGIMLSMLQFDELTYLSKGNQVRLVKKINLVSGPG